jgi:hypothetical protein
VLELFQFAFTRRVDYRERERERRANFAKRRTNPGTYTLTNYTWCAPRAPSLTLAAVPGGALYCCSSLSASLIKAAPLSLISLWRRKHTRITRTNNTLAVMLCAASLFNNALKLCHRPPACVVPAPIYISTQRPK